MAKTKIRLLESYEKELLEKGMKKEGPIITVAGFGGSGKSSVVDMLKKAFPGFRVVYSGGIYREKADEAGMSVEEFCAKNDDDEFALHVEKEVLRRSLPGNAIVDGRLAAWTLGGWADFRIFVSCPFGTRVDRVAKREGISSASARNSLESRDASNSRHYLELYGIDVRDLSVYDLIIDNSGTFAELERGVRKLVERVRRARSA